jgi:prepilin-type N-terminal cleavage/methylation domain-containing protein
MKKRLGFSLVEVIVAISIVLILSSVGLVSNTKRSESNAKIMVEEQLPIFFETVFQKSNESGKRYKIHCELSERVLEIREIETEVLLDKLELPETLNYVFFNSKKELVSEIDRNTTNTGNISKGFSIYIFDRKGLAIDKFSLSNTTEFIKYAKLSEKKPTKDMYLINFAYGRELSEDEEELIDYNNWE